MSTYKKRRKNLEENISHSIKSQYDKLASELPDEKKGKMAAHVSLKFIKENNHIVWDMKELSMNEEVTLVFITSKKSWNWDWTEITKRICKKEMWKTIEYNSELSWDWKWMSATWNCSAPWCLIRKLIKKEWDWEYLSMRYSFDFSMLDEFPDISWDYRELSNAGTLRPDVMYEHRGDWDFHAIQRHYWFEWGLVEAYPEGNWYWIGLSRKANIPVSTYVKTMSKGWDMFLVKKNLLVKTDMDFKLIRENLPVDLQIELLPLDWQDFAGEDYWWVGKDLLAGPGGEKRRERIIIRETRRQLAACRIQRWWKNIMVDEKHPVGYRLTLQNAIADSGAIEKRNE